MEKEPLPPSNTVSWQKNIRCQLNGCGCSKNPFIWVSERLRCVYFEIPKTGSSSVKSVIKQPELGFASYWDSPTAAARRFDKYYKFTVIRHPVSRMLSNYKMFCLSDRESRHRQIEALFGKSHDLISLEEFIALAVRRRNHHWEKMVNYLPANVGVATIETLDKVLCTETLASGWKDVQRALDLRNDLPWNNSSAEIAYAPDLQEADRRAIETRYAEDLLLFDRYARGETALLHERDRSPGTKGSP